VSVYISKIYLIKTLL